MIEGGQARNTQLQTDTEGAEFAAGEETGEGTVAEA